MSLKYEFGQAARAHSQLAAGSFDCVVVDARREWRAEEGGRGGCEVCHNLTINLTIKIAALACHARLYVAFGSKFLDKTIPEP